MASGNFIKTFGNNNPHLFTFPGTQSQVRDNFSDVVPRTVRVPGANGGFDQFGLDPAPTEIGNVAVTFGIEVYDPGDMQAERDEIRAMAAWGVQKLVKTCGDAGDRYCWARVNSIVMTESPSGGDGISTNILLSVTINFQVAEPGWFDDTNWTTPTALATPRTSDTGDPTETAIVIGGLFPVFPRITIEAGSGDLAEVGISIRAADEVLGGISECEFETGDLGHPTIIVDCASMRVLDSFTNPSPDGLALFGSVTYFAYANFFALAPGTWYVKTYAVGATSPTAEIQWREKY